MKTKSYSELIRYRTFIERYEYLRLFGRVGEETFGSRRYLNQKFYGSKEWREVKRQIILRDNGCDLGIDDRAISRGLVIHHINPVTLDDILKGSDLLFDPENLICVSTQTHQAIHYGDSSLLVLDPVERMPNDTCLWRR